MPRTFPPRVLTLALLVASGSAIAQSSTSAPNEGARELKLAAPPASMRSGRIEVDLVPGGRNSGSDVAPAAPSQAQGPQLPDTGGLPRIPAADSTAPLAPAAVGSPTASPGAGLDPVTKGFQPGQPVPTYSTMQEAAQAGLDPMPELALSASERDAQEPVARMSFDWKDPGAYLAWIQANTASVGMYGGGLFVLLAAGWLVLRRRSLD